MLPQNQEKLLNIWLRQTFQKQIKTSEQQLLVDSIWAHNLRTRILPDRGLVVK